MAIHDPLTQCSKLWRKAQRANDPAAYCMTLAMCDARGNPSARTIIIKSIDEAGIGFVTQALGKKGKALAAKPKVALSMHWPTIATQITVSGRVRTMPKEQLLQLWNQRDRDAQILYHMGVPQSSAVESFASLRSALRQAKKQWQGVADIPLAESYVGFVVQPTSIEILSHTITRLNKREYLTKRGNTWTCKILAP